MYYYYLFHFSDGDTKAQREVKLLVSGNSAENQPSSEIWAFNFSIYTASLGAVCFGKWVWVSEKCQSGPCFG